MTPSLANINIASHIIVNVIADASLFGLTKMLPCVKF